MNKSFTILIIFSLIIQLNAQEWVRRGQTIHGTNNSVIGSCVVMPDANTIASAGLFGNRERIYVHRWDSSTESWVEKGSQGITVTGSNASHSIYMPDSNTIAIGAPHGYPYIGDYTGYASVFDWHDTAWVQRGMDIPSEYTNGNLGVSVFMPDVNTIAASSVSNYNSRGHVRIYDWDGSAWVQRGLDIDGEAAGDLSGMSISMPDVNTIAIGAPNNIHNGSFSGHVRVYDWDGSAWIHRYADIDGEAAEELFGSCISMPDVNTLAISGPLKDSSTGCVRVYDWNMSTTSWIKRGIDLKGEAKYVGFGSSLSMPDINTLAVSSQNSLGLNGEVYAGQVRLYKWDGNDWVQEGMPIYGEQASDRIGASISMPDASTILIGSTNADGSNGQFNDVGLMSVFKIKAGTNTTVLAREIGMRLYPNPSAGVFMLNCADIDGEAVIRIFDAKGSEVLVKNTRTKETVVDMGHVPAGIYYVKLHVNGKEAQQVMVLR